MASRLALGTAQFGMNYGISNKTGKVCGREAFLVLEKAEELNIDTLDTAIGYGDSEKCLGLYGVANFKVITKLASVPDDIVDIATWVEESIQTSLDRLQIKKLHCILLHEPEFLVSNRGVDCWHGLERLKGRGVVNKIGVSIYSPAILDKLFGNFSLDIIQAPLNILDRRMIDSGWLEKLASKNVEVHARSAFLQGLLLLKKEERPVKFNSWKVIFSKWDAWLKENNLDPVHVCISFLALQKNINKIVVGVENVKQLVAIDSFLRDPFLKKFPEISSEDEDLINPSRWRIS